MNTLPPPPNPSNDAFDRFIRRAAEERKDRLTANPQIWLPPEQHARCLTVYSLSFGFCSSLLLILIIFITNRIILEGLPLYEPAGSSLTAPFTILCTGTIFSFITVQTAKFQSRVLFWILTILFLFVLVNNTLTYKSLFAGVMQGLAFAFLIAGPLITGLLMLIPFGLLFHWAANAQVKYFDRPWWSFTRTLSALALLGTVILCAILFVYTPQEAKAARAMDKLLQEGLSAQSLDDVPKALVNMDGAPVLLYAGGSFYLEPIHEPGNTAAHFGSKPFSRTSVVRAYFENGYYLTCQVSNYGVSITCSSDWIPLPPISIQDQNL